MSRSDRIADGLFAIAHEIHQLVVVLAGAPMLVRARPVEVNEHGRCKQCNGSGLGDDGDSYCDCPLGRDLKRLHS